MPQLMSMGLSGVPFVGTDVGGFFGNASGELFARWMQLGVLTPFCRGHSVSGSERHEPWVFGPRVEAICREYLRLRYRLLPYLYSLFWEASSRGAPILRPLLYHFHDDPATYQIHDQVMLGPWLLAAPIYHPGRDYRSVYLPKGDWHDWWSGERIASAGEPILARAPLERMPLYARAGAIIPSGPDMAHTQERLLDPLTLDLFPGDGEWTLYEDDGHSHAYQQGAWCTTRYTLRLEGNRLSFAIAAREGAYTPTAREVIIRVNGTETWEADGDTPFDAASRTSALADAGQAHVLRLLRVS
jgi:alpha-glucosidase